jgi:hypothetical protein
MLQKRQGALERPVGRLSIRHVRYKQRELAWAGLRAPPHRLEKPMRRRRPVGDDQNTSGLRHSRVAHLAATVSPAT